MKLKIQTTVVTGSNHFQINDIVDRMYSFKSTFPAHFVIQQ